MEAAGVPAARTLAAPAPPCVVKADGLAAGKGVVVCRNDDELASGLEPSRAPRRRDRRRGAPRGPGGIRAGRVRRRDGRSTSSGAGLQARPRRRPGPEHRRHGLVCARPWHRRRRDRRDRRPPSTRPCCASWHAGGSPFVGHALRGAHAHSGGAAGARVQLPVRRPGDADAATAGRPRPARGSVAAASGELAGPPSRRTTSPPSRWCSPRVATRPVEIAAQPSSASKRRRRPAHSCSTPERPYKTARLVTNGGRILNVTATGGTLAAARTDLLCGRRPTSAGQASACAPTSPRPRQRA